ncbi:unnamed protein product [Moneuplotes crassus]|uniref:Uncharacterized protein n=1 Tax=Euplotes crassus TaxID=5936 RepID=A0AAD1XFV7_EUPCR|nr:unnamed protein product [Moneuplotes crassus]
MNKEQQFEENCSDELLDEHVLVSKVRKLSHLEENMARSPFHNEIAFNKAYKALTVRVQRDASYNLSESKQSEEVAPLRNPKKLKSEMLPPKCKIQNDIKNLLHQVIDIREKSHRSPDFSFNKRAVKRDGNMRRKAYAREITMKDNSIVYNILIGPLMILTE